MDSAPTMPMDSAMFDLMHMTTGVVIMHSMISVVAKEGEKSTPRKALRYTSAMIIPTMKPSPSASTIFMGVRFAICWENHSLTLASLMKLFMTGSSTESIGKMESVDGKTASRAYSASGLAGQGPK